MSESKKIVYLVDDHPIFREGLKKVIESRADLKVGGGYEDKLSVAKALRAQKADLVILELELQSENTLEFMKDLCAEFTGLRILVITGLKETIYAERALSAGASGFLSNKCSVEELMIAVDAILRGEIFTSEGFTSQLLKRIFIKKMPTGEGDKNPVSQLSDRELEIFEMLGQGKKTRKIAVALKLSIKTVETHRENIKRKLSLSDAPSLIHFATLWNQQKMEGGTER